MMVELHRKPCCTVVPTYNLLKQKAIKGKANTLDPKAVWFT